MTTLALEDERRLLYNALATEGFRFILIVQHHPSVYREIRGALIERFGQRRKIHEFSFRQKSPSDIREAIRRLGSGILLMRDVEYLFQREGQDLRVYFNQRRDLWGSYDIAFVLFLEPSSLQLLPKLLPDWWSLRSLELEFTAPSSTLPTLETVWGDVRETSPYANWMQEQRDAEIARLGRLIADTDTGNARLLARLHADLAEVLQYSHQPEAAMETYQKSLALATQAQYQDLTGEVLNNIGHIYHTQGDYDTAQRYLEEALATHQAVGNPTGEGIALINLAKVARMKGDYDTALRHLEQALTICRNTSDRQGESIALNNISQIYQARGNSDTALRYLEQALTTQRQIGDRKGEGVTLNNIGFIYYTLGDYATALQYFEQSLAISQEPGNRAGESIALNGIASIARAKGDYATALRYLEQARAMERQIGSRQGESVILNDIGLLYMAKGEHDTALHYLEQALAIQQQTGNRPGEGATLTNIGQIYQEKGDYNTALHYLKSALAIWKQIGDRQGEGTTLNGLGVIAYARGEGNKALRYWEQALSIQREIGDAAGQAATLTNLGAFYWAQQRDAKKAIPPLIQALQILDRLGSPDVRHPAEYLEKIRQAVGEVRFQALSGM